MPHLPWASLTCLTSMGMANPIPADAPVLVNMAVLIPIKLPEESWNGTRTYDMGSNGSIEPRSDTNDACTELAKCILLIPEGGRRCFLG